MSDWKLGYCTSNPFANREACCTNPRPFFVPTKANLGEGCDEWHMWTDGWYRAFGIYVGFALVFGLISASLTMLTKSTLPAAAPGRGDQHQGSDASTDQPVTGKSIYLAAGSGIPEIKTILSGFVIPHFLDFKVLSVKAVGAVFAVATGMCLGKEGPFVHISTCVAYMIGTCFPKYRENGRKLRELLSAGCSSGLSVAFGAPIGGILFSYEVGSPGSLHSSRVLNLSPGDQHLLSPQGALASFFLFSLGRCDTESAQPHGHRKACALRDELWKILFSSALPHFYTPWHSWRALGRHVLQVQFPLVEKLSANPHR